MPPSPRFLRSTILVLAVGLLGVGLVWGLSGSGSGTDPLPQVFAWIQSLGPWGPLVVGALFVPVCLLFLPGSPLTLFGGFAFGKTLPGFLAVTAAVSLGSTLGATLAFLVGRTIARSWIERRVAGNPQFQAIDAAVGERGFRLVLLTRLSPLLPFNLLNYAFGLTQVSLRDYILGSWLGMLPGTVLFLYLGATLGDLADVISGRIERTPIQQAFFYGGLAATLVLVVVIGRIAQRAIQSAIPRDSTSEPPPGSCPP